MTARRYLKSSWVLAPSGMLVLQVPILGQVTYEDASVTLDSERLEKFLQEDHVRLYGLDLKRRAEESGFSCAILSSTSLPPSDQNLYSLKNPLYREVFVCRKLV